MRFLNLPIGQFGDGSVDWEDETLTQTIHIRSWQFWLL